MASFPAWALKAAEILAMVLGLAYSVLAVRRNRLCWVAGAVASALLMVLAALQKLPMQSGLQLFFVAMSVYGWFTWKRSSGEGELPVGVWPLKWHLAAGVSIALLSLLSARWLAHFTHAAWPLLDSLTTWFSLLATWLVARGRIENWLYWIAIDTILVFLFWQQDLPWIAAQMLLYIGIAYAGFLAWRKRMPPVAVPA
jgi:nicotinamide mononucleotide transporter